MNLLDLSLDVVRVQICNGDNPREQLCQLPDDLITKLLKQPPSLFAGNMSKLTQPLTSSSDLKHIHGVAFTFEELIPLIKSYQISIPDDEDEEPFRFEILEMLDRCLAGLAPIVPENYRTSYDYYISQHRDKPMKEIKADFDNLSPEEKQTLKDQVSSINSVFKEYSNKLAQSWIRIFRYPCCYQNDLEEKEQPWIIIGILVRSRKFEYKSDITQDLAVQHITPNKLYEYFMGNVNCVPSEQIIKLRTLVDSWGFSNKPINDYLLPNDCYSCT